LVAVLAAPSAFAQDDDDLLVAPKPQGKSKTTKKPRTGTTGTKTVKKTPPKPKTPKKATVKRGKKSGAAAQEELAKTPETQTPDETPVSAEEGKTELLVKVSGNLKGARLYVDNQEVGPLPLPVQPITPGEHTIIVRRPGYTEFSQRVTVEAGRLTELTATMEPVAGVVAVTADVPGAAVYIDGEPAGTAPLSGMPLKPGSHDIEVRRQGFATESKRIAVRAGKDYTVDFHLRASSDAPKVASREEGGKTETVKPRVEPKQENPAEVALRPDAETSGEVESGSTPLLKRWYFWAGVGAVAAGAVVGAVVLTQQPGQAPPLTPAGVCGGTCDGTINAPTTTGAGVVRF
jgi:hypothetical protein